jgi:hypothetical protein
MIDTAQAIAIEGDAPSPRTVAFVAGVLFIITFVSSIAGALLYGPVLADPGSIAGAGADIPVRVGVLCEVILVIANIGCAIVLFPILRHTNEAVALGYVAARIMECTLIVIGFLALLAVVTLRLADAGSIGTSLVAIHNWTFLLGPGFVDGIGTGLLLGYLMYRSALVPRPMALFGLIGGPLLAISGIAVLLGVIPQFSPWQGIATIPEVIWEAFLGLYLTFHGFRATQPARVGT